MDPVLHDILWDGGLEQTTYNKAGLASSGKYWQLQKNQMEIGWDNLIQGKYSKHWRIIQHNFTKKGQRQHKAPGSITITISLLFASLGSSGVWVFQTYKWSLGKSIICVIKT